MRKIVLTSLLAGYVIAHLSCAGKKSGGNNISPIDRPFQERMEDRKKVEEFNRSKEEKEENEKAIREFNEKAKEKAPDVNDAQN